MTVSVQLYIMVPLGLYFKMKQGNSSCFLTHCIETELNKYTQACLAENTKPTIRTITEMFRLERLCQMKSFTVFLVPLAGSKPIITLILTIRITAIEILVVVH